MGAEADVDGHRVIVGNARMLAERHVTSPVDPDGRLPALTGNGRSIVFVVVDGALAGTIALSDRPREAARDTVDRLREHGVGQVAILTGDHPDAARAIATAVGVDEYYAALTPDQKHARVRRLREAHGPILMVGDGINDAPALAAADVGVAMGAAGSDAALETADVALMSDELLKLPYAVRLARATLRNIKTNVAISLALKAAFLVLAVTGSATLWMAVLADTGASVIVVGNALRLLRAR
jgi:Cd2+/Zn2+-exporting ATPase